MERQELTRRREELTRVHGPWHDNVPLGDGVYTVAERVTPDQLRVRAIVRAAADALRRPLEGTRVLDLGAAEGAFAIELALHGAEVVALEGRPGNVEKMRLAKEALGLDRLEIVQSDVRDLARAAEGEFDLVLCLGLLYHLDGPDGVALAHDLARVCRGVAVVDTHIAFKGKSSTTVEGRTYRGRIVREFDPGAVDQQERLSRVSIGNPDSVWFTGPSLYNLLHDAGFTSVLELRVPRFEISSDRVTLVAFKGSPQPFASAPAMDEVDGPRWPERERLGPHSNQTRRGRLMRRLAPWTPAPLKEWVLKRQERRRLK